MDVADYVVVGAGSAGAALAGRLSEDPDVRVLLLEAGGPDAGDLFEVPALWGRAFTTQHDWDYSSEPEPHLGGRRGYLPSGKVLGGTSSINGMIYMRGAASDYDAWATQGAHGWGWADVLPYFKRAERNARGASALHGDAGPLHVGDRISENPLVEAWVAAAVAAGHSPNDDFNGDRQEGVGVYQLTQHDGVRCSTAVAYLRPALERPNLELRMHAHARDLVLERGRAVGVRYERFGELHEVRAEREAIVCAGAYNSPQLLMHSGIGPAEHLRALGIRVHADLPVGDGLQDHPGVPLVVATDGPSLLGVGSERDWARYRSERRGPLASNVVEGGGFFRTHPQLAECDVQTVVQPTVGFDARAPLLQHGFTAVVEVTRPTSVGTVRLRNGEPTSKPRVTHNHLATEEDRASLVEGLRLNMEIFAGAPLSELARERVLWPGSDGDDALLAFARRHAFGVFHPSSSCAIGRVVDSELRVHGVEGLRVADASVLPTNVRGNPNAVIVMVGEKAADLVRGRSSAGEVPATTMAGGVAS